MKKSYILTFVFGGFINSIIITILLLFLSMPKKEQVKFVPAPEGFAVMIFDENAGDYLESDSLPIGSYKLNNEKSYCANGGTIESYDDKNGKVNYSVDGTDECVIYLDIVEFDFYKESIEKEKAKLEVEVDAPEYPVPGNTMTADVTIRNEGFEALNGYELTVSGVGESVTLTKEVIANQEEGKDNHAILPGREITIPVEIKVPEDFDKTFDFFCKIIEVECKSYNIECGYNRKNNKYEEKDKYLYYVTCTRAQHNLIVYNGKY